MKGVKLLIGMSVILAVTSVARAGVVYNVDAAALYTIGGVDSAPPVSQPIPDRDDDAAHRRLLAALLASLPLDGGMGTSSTSTFSGASSAPALAAWLSPPPQPVLIAWLDSGRYLALASLPPSGLFRPPRAA
ncbi:MAG: hypothetical protein ACREHD_17445 [Pirellulales bacterium]